MTSKLCIPEKLLSQHMVVLGKTGKGKSSVLRHIVEHLLRQKKRVCILDPKGDWWGLKTSADGKSPGFPVIAFGDFREPKSTDVKINADSGQEIAKLIQDGNRPCVIGFRGWMQSQMVKFWLNFAPSLFHFNLGELFLIGDEFHNFAPKGKILDPDAGKCLHWSNRIMSEGRGAGLICLIASQRPQKVHNDTLTCCETLIALGVNHPADREAVKDWIDGCGDKQKGNEVLSSLAGLPRGEGYVWSPENNFGPERIKFPLFETFDSFAAPQLQKKVSEAGWAEVDLEEVQVKLAKVIEEHKANDPAELKKQIAFLQREIRTAKPPETKVEVKEVPAIKIEVFQELETNFTKVRTALDMCHNVMFEMMHTVKKISQSRLSQTTTHVPKENRFYRENPKSEASCQSESSGSLGRCERAILKILAQYPAGKTSNQIAVHTGYANSSGGFNNSLGKLRSNGWITRSIPIQITEEGLKTLGDFEPLPTGQALLNQWLSKLRLCERSILQALASQYPDGMIADQLAHVTGYSSNSGGFNNALGRLRTLELITRGQPIKAMPVFFEE